MKKLAAAAVCILMTAAAFTVSLAECFFGDLNNDGRITASDARIALRAAARLTVLENAKAADINSDGAVTAADARLLLRISARLENIDDYTSSAPDSGSGVIMPSLTDESLSFPDDSADTLPGAPPPFIEIESEQSGASELPRELSSLLGEKIDSISHAAELSLSDRRYYPSLYSDTLEFFYDSNGVIGDITISGGEEYHTLAGIGIGSRYGELAEAAATLPDGVSIGASCDENQIITRLYIYRDSYYDKIHSLETYFGSAVTYLTNDIPQVKRISREEFSGDGIYVRTRNNLCYIISIEDECDYDIFGIYVGCSREFAEETVSNLREAIEEFDSLYHITVECEGELVKKVTLSPFDS